MRLLLPPSEAKSTGGRGRPLRDRHDDSLLAQPRERAMKALDELVRGDRAAATEALLLPAGVASDALAANACVQTSATAPALRRYSGVVYDGLSFATLPPAMQRIAARSTLIFSGLFGVVRGDEPVPMYRVPAKAVLPGCGVAATYWRPMLDDVMPELLDDGLVIDLRSTDYAAMWRPSRALAERVVTVRLLSPKPGGGFGVISYNSKLAKGRLAAALVGRIAARSRVETVDDIVDAWREAGGLRAESPRAGHLDLLTT